MSEFHFNTKLDQTMLLGIRARNAGELLKGLARVPDSSVYYHTHRFLEQHHFLSPEPPNDFAYWVSNVLNDDVLGEQLASVDLVQFESIRSLREEFIAIVQSHCEATPGGNTSPPGEDFHFMASRLFVLPTGYTAHDMAEFRDILSRISISSLYYHMFDARLRLGNGENDFSRWFRDQGLAGLAADVARLDPYRHTLEGLRKRILILSARYDAH
jgi:hypothetical protein